MTISFVLGNGRSRLALDLNALRSYGKIYACNGIYREFTPDVLVATDRPIARAIEESGYAQKNVFYTRRPIAESGALSLKRPYQGYSSGPNAVALACYDNSTTVYMIGFDFGSPTPYLNNIYADTEFYRSSRDKATFAGNWVKQLTQICRDFPRVNFARVMGKESIHIPEFANIPNLKSVQIVDFWNQLNSVEGKKVNKE